MNRCSYVGAKIARGSNLGKYAPLLPSAARGRNFGIFLRSKKCLFPQAYFSDPLGLCHIGIPTPNIGDQ